MMPGAVLAFGMIVPDETALRVFRASSSGLTSTGFGCWTGARFGSAFFTGVSDFGATMMALPEVFVTMVPEDATRRDFRSCTGAGAGSTLSTFAAGGSADVPGVILPLTLPD